MNCGVCANQPLCWERGEQTALVNLLICRLQGGLHRNETTKQILDVLAPKIRSVAWYLARRTEQRITDVTIDVQHYIITALLTEYRLGEALAPLPWLFHPRFGAVKTWSRRYIAAHTTSFSDEEIDELCAPDEEPEDDDAEDTLDYARLKEIINDGKTLTAGEFRILSLCITTGRSVGALNHPWIAKHLRRSRQDVTQIYNVARAKVLRALNDAPKKSPEQVRQAVQRNEMSVVEAAVELGVSVRWAYQLRSAHG